MFLLDFNWESSVGKVLGGSGVLSKWVTYLDLLARVCHNLRNPSCPSCQPKDKSP